MGHNQLVLLKLWFNWDTCNLICMWYVYLTYCQSHRNVFACSRALNIIDLIKILQMNEHIKKWDRSRLNLAALVGYLGFYNKDIYKCECVFKL